MQYCLNYSGQGFCPLKKITITQFPDVFRLNTFTAVLFNNNNNIQYL